MRTNRVLQAPENNLNKFIYRKAILYKENLMLMQSENLTTPSQGLFKFRGTIRICDNLAKDKKTVIQTSSVVLELKEINDQNENVMDIIKQAHLDSLNDNFVQQYQNIIISNSSILLKEEDNISLDKVYNKIINKQIDREQCIREWHSLAKRQDLLTAKGDPTPFNISQKTQFKKNYDLKDSDLD